MFLPISLDLHPLNSRRGKRAFPSGGFRHRQVFLATSELESRFYLPI